MPPAEIRRRRQALGVSQNALARLFGCSSSTVSRWEQGVSAPDMPGMLDLAFRWLESEGNRKAPSDAPDDWDAAQPVARGESK